MTTTPRLIAVATLAVLSTLVASARRTPPEAAPADALRATGTTGEPQGPASTVGLPGPGAAGSSPRPWEDPAVSMRGVEPARATFVPFGTVEEALGRLSSELGPGARIVRADRVRKGGIAGFFAREVVEIEAEVRRHGSRIAILAFGTVLHPAEPASALGLLLLGAGMTWLARAAGAPAPDAARTAVF